MSNPPHHPGPALDIATVPPVGAPYVAKIWHHDRASFKGLEFEARIIAKRLLGRGGAPARGRFLILTRARSGSTLFTKLLDSVDGIRCEGEVLHHVMFDPAGHLRRLAQVAGAPVHGAKLMSYQMLEVHRMKDPRGFLARRHDEGVRLVHLRRGTLQQCLSLTMAQTTRDYFHRKTAPPRTIDPQAFVAQVRWNEALLQFEERILADLPHITVEYERDLQNAADHPAAVGRICDLFDLLRPPAVAAAPLKKLLKSTLHEVLDNAAEIEAALRGGGLGHLLPDAADPDPALPGAG
jgi:LPS sulfotransferase NodH